MTPVALKILMVEDDELDARLIERELRQAGFSFECTRVQDESSFLREVDGGPDLILCDWNLPQFGAERALELLSERSSVPPVLVISGSIGEEAAAKAIRSGADDYLLKDRLGRLGPAVKQAIEARALQVREEKARKERDAAEGRYRSLVDMAPDGIGIFQDDKLVYINPAGVRMFGVRDASQLLGTPASALTDPADLSDIAARHATVIRENRPAPLRRTRVPRPDGQWMILESCAGPCEHEGRPAIQIIARDVTDKVRDEQRLRESEARFRAVVDQAGDGMILIDPESLVCIDANPRAGELLGYPDRSLVGVDLHTIDVDYTAELAREMGTEMADGRSVTVERRYRLRDGTIRPFEVCVGPVQMDGRTLGLALVRDISARRRAEASLRGVMASVPDAIVTIDAGGIIRSVNAATERLFGYGERELLGRDVSMLMPAAHRERHGEYIRNYLTTGVAKVIGIGREVEAARKDGTRFPAYLSIAEFELDGARHFAGVVTDITQRKKLEEQFRHAQKMEAVGRLAGGIAHDFNNLLTVINSYSEMLLLDLPKDGTIREDIAEIRAAGERAAGLTAQLLAFSRKAIVEPRDVDLSQLIGQSERLLRRLIGEDVTLLSRLPPGLGRVRIDPNQVDQVVMNLAVNARDAMPRGGTLAIEARELELRDARTVATGTMAPGRYVELAVSDSGTGMSEEVLRHIFDPFFSTKGAGRGTGLGLSVVMGVVQQAGGHIDVETSVGRGTTFFVYLPVVASDVAGPVTHSEHPKTEGATVLLVEDEDAVRRISRIGLEAHGYTVLEASSGEDALSIAEAHRGPIDLLVTDVVMPEMSGRELADTLRARAPSLRVLYVSGYTDDAIVHHGVRDQQWSLLQKPFTPAGLARKVWSVLAEPAPRPPR